MRFIGVVRAGRAPVVDLVAVAVVLVGVSGCNPSREAASTASAPVPTSLSSVASAMATALPLATAPAVSASSTPLDVPFTDFFDVDQLGTEPVRGSGCGVERSIGDALPDGLWRGFIRSFDGLWVDGSSSLEFDLACVYVGDAAVLARQHWLDENPGEQPTDLRDGFMVNDNDRVRVVPLAAEFVQVDAVETAGGGCVPPDVPPPSGATERYRLLDSWLLVDGGEAQWAVTSCPGAPDPTRVRWSLRSCRGWSTPRASRSASPRN